MHSPSQNVPSERRLRKFELSEYALPAFIILLSAGVSFADPRFLSGSNLANLAAQLAPLLILSVGQAFAVISGGLDLSMASAMALAGVAGTLVTPIVGVGGAVVVMLVIGAIIGLLSGVIIAYLKTSPLIVTLGMASVAQAFALILANGIPLYSVSPILTKTVGFGTMAGVPITFLIGVVVLLAGAVILRKTVLGRYIYAIGSNRSAAVKSGVNAPLYTMIIYGLSGLTAGIAAVVMTSWIGAAQPTPEEGLNLEAIAAIVLGGIALTGGSGGMLHAFYGVLILGMLSNAMNMLGISSYYQILAVGTVIIIAVILDRFRRREM